MKRPKVRPDISPQARPEITAFPGNGSQTMSNAAGSCACFAVFIAWLRTGSNSVISHESALTLYNLSDVLPGEIHIIIPRTASRRRSGLRLHTNQLKPEEITTREGLPVTTAERTIADVAIDGLPRELVVQSINEAIDRGLITREELLAQADYQGGRAKRIIYETLK